jgi:uncharacterized membrane protein (DUF485 family)
MFIHLHVLMSLAWLVHLHMLVFVVVVLHTIGFTRHLHCTTVVSRACTFALVVSLDGV